MSREERRQYERMMKNMDRGAALPPAARARAERNATRRAARQAAVDPTKTSGLRSWVRPTLIVVAIGFVAFSLQWSEGMPRALYAGLIAGVLALILLLGFRYLQRRAAARRG